MYETLGAIEVEFKDGKLIKYNHAEAGVSMNYLIVYQEKIKTCLDLKDLVNWKIKEND